MMLRKVLVLLTATLALAVPNARADKHLMEVQVSKNCRYIVVEQGSDAQSQLGLDSAPYVDSSGSLNNTGTGIDAIAFVFDKNGVLAKPPVYISDFGLNAVSDYYRTRLRGLTIGTSTRRSVETLFGPLSPDNQTPFIAYVKVTTFNPFAHSSSSWGH